MYRPGSQVRQVEFFSRFSTLIKFALRLSVAVTGEISPSPLECEVHISLGKRGLLTLEIPIRSEIVQLKCVFFLNLDMTGLDIHLPSNIFIVHPLIVGLPGLGQP